MDGKSLANCDIDKVIDTRDDRKAGNQINSDIRELTATLTSAWLLTGDNRYSDKALEHMDGSVAIQGWLF